MPAGEYVEQAHKGLGDHASLSHTVNRMRKRLKMLWIAVALLAICTLALLAGLIAVGVARSDDDSSVTALPGKSGALLSTSNVTPDGFVSKGVLDASSGTWVLKAQFPGAAGKGVSDGSAVTVGDKVYFLGGHLGGTTGNNVTNLVTIYDPLSDAFTVGPPLPKPVARGSAAFDGKSTIYYVAGQTRASSAANSTVLGDKGAAGAQAPCLFALDTAATGNAARWRSLKCMNQPRSDFCAAWVDDKLYVVGGLDPVFSPPLDSIESYDPAENTWTTEKYTLPAGRCDLACTVIGNDIYAVGGVATDSWGADITTWFSDANARIRPSTGKIEMLAPLPKPRGDLAVAPFRNGTLLAVGGETHDLQGTRTMIGTHEVFLYDTLYDVWVPKAPMPEARFRAAAVQVPTNDNEVAVVVMGGHHRCERAKDDNQPNDDGGCDEIAFASMFIDTSTPPLFVFSSA